MNTLLMTPHNATAAVLHADHSRGVGSVICFPALVSFDLLTAVVLSQHPPCCIPFHVTAWGRPGCPLVTSNPWVLTQTPGLTFNLCAYLLIWAVCVCVDSCALCLFMLRL